MRFPKSHRLLNKTDYNQTLDNALKVSYRSLLVLFKPNQREHSRLGLIIGKRVAALAVSRNRIKRAVRESFRLHQENFPGLDIVVIARQQCDKLSKQELLLGMKKLWERVIAQYPKV